MKEKLKKYIHFLLALAAYWWYGRPARHLIVIGVTGTKGKSTTCRLIASVLEAGGYKTGMMTTVEFQIGKERWANDKKMTMLGRGQIQQILKRMVDAGCRYAVVETSSQGILQYRHYGLDYDVVVFTNLAPEHVEAHGGFENLKRDKGLIFADLMKKTNKTVNGKSIPKIIISNFGDRHAGYYLNFKADKKIAYGLSHGEFVGADYLLGKITASTGAGINFTAGNFDFHLNILGEFNVYNALAAVAVGKSQGITEDKIAAGLAAVHVVEGRMEEIKEGQDFKVIVDYAHEPLSLTELFNSLRKMAPQGKIIAVIGSDGGGRDRSKRGKMGEIAGRVADFIVISDVNCFDEDPHEIAEMLAVGARAAGKKDNENLFIEVDRRKGIAKAISLAQAGDVVVITAKGTEPCIVQAGGYKLPWDDRQVARELLKQKINKNSI